MTQRRIARYGWRPDLPDARDYLPASPPISPRALPSAVDLRGPFMPPVYDQGRLGSCTANAIAAAVDYERARQGMPHMTPSRLFIYWNEREIEGDIDTDGGAQIRDGIKSVGDRGVCSEILPPSWPYAIDKFAVKPPGECFLNATTHRALKYARVAQTTLHLRNQLATEKCPVVFGFTVYESFESDEVARTGIVPMPGRDEKAIGGHAVMLVGYDDAKRRFLVRNSWGAGWGDKGYFHMPYDYACGSGYAADFWSIALESGTSKDADASADGA